PGRAQGGAHRGLRPAAARRRTPRSGARAHPCGGRRLMAAVVPKHEAIREFATRQAFEAWLAAHHASAGEVWIKIAKKGAQRPSITAAEALEVVLCWGWIDGIRKAFDEASFLQRYSPRG